MKEYRMRCCYGRYNGFRVKRVGMQEITGLFQFLRQGMVRSCGQQT